MEQEIINFETKRIEQKLVPISRKLDMAVELLVDARRELEELYITLPEEGES